MNLFLINSLSYFHRKYLSICAPVGARGDDRQADDGADPSRMLPGLSEVVLPAIPTRPSRSVS